MIKPIERMHGLDKKSMNLSELEQALAFSLWQRGTPTEIKKTRAIVNQFYSLVGTNYLLGAKIHTNGTYDNVRCVVGRSTNYDSLLVGLGMGNGPDLALMLAHVPERTVKDSIRERVTKQILGEKKYQELLKTRQLKDWLSTILPNREVCHNWDATADVVLRYFRPVGSFSIGGSTTYEDFEFETKTSDVWIPRWEDESKIPYNPRELLGQVLKNVE